MNHAVRPSNRKDAAVCRRIPLVWFFLVYTGGSDIVLFIVVELKLLAPLLGISGALVGALNKDIRQFLVEHARALSTWPVPMLKSTFYESILWASETVMALLSAYTQLEMLLKQICCVFTDFSDNTG